MYPKVGSLYSVKMPCLGNPEGTLGVCYETYNLSGCIGFSFIFQNGRYDGFSIEEVKFFLEFQGFDDSVSEYTFTNVMQLSQDFDKQKLGIISKIKDPIIIGQILDAFNPPKYFEV